jgi:tol-pal system protein YbgF
MKKVRGLLVSTSAAFALFVVLGGMAGPAPAAQSVTVDARDLLVRMQRMERDIRDLQAETFRRPPGAPADAAPAPPTGAMPDLSPIMRRMDEFGDSLTRLTGQMEELSHQVDLLSQKADRLQKEMDYQAQQAAQAQAAPPPAAAGAAPGNEVASLAKPSDAPTGQPQGGVLGQLPADADIAASAPSGAPDAKAEFDTAMALLTRGQTMPASEAFRAFVAAHPDDERAPTALYWTGDIAYSTSKDYEGAARNFVELLKKYPMSARAPEGMLKLGLALLELGQMKEGCAALAALPAKYPAASPAIATRARNERRDNKCR